MVASDVNTKMWLIAFALSIVSVQGDASSDLTEKVWNHGSEDCASNHDPAVEVYQFDAATYILRENKCVHFEAPFIYVMFGEHTVFVQDTGATADPSRFPLYDTVQSLIAQRHNEELKILVTHSHSHGDHTAADSQFREKPGVTMIEPNAKAVREYFGFENWPEGLATIDLGERTLGIVPTPGHQEEGVAVYDSRTGWLLTGDNLYPGRLYVNNWTQYRASIGRLVEFSRTHRIVAVLGSHIEMSSTGKLFPTGSRFQPNEANLALAIDDLSDLNDRLRRDGEKPREIVMTKFVVVPVGVFQRILGGFLKWMGAR